MGKVIYQPNGKAGEYANWACNLYVGCSNNCDYCYCKKGVLSSVMGGPVPTLKKGLRNKEHALEVFISEITKDADDIRRSGGLFFSFSTDPCLPDTVCLTLLCVMVATGMDIPCSILTKCTDWAGDPSVIDSLRMVREKVAIGFTLTGMDEMERGETVAPNAQRIALMRKLHDEGFLTFASIEPVIELKRSREMILRAVNSCDFFEIGLLSGNVWYDQAELEAFEKEISALFDEKAIPVYWKESFRKAIGHAPSGKTAVQKAYNVFERNAVMNSVNSNQE